MPHATDGSPVTPDSFKSINDSIDTTALNELDGEPRQLLDTIDKLRYLGVDSYVELPQIIVVGDQSSGKSSVLEAISRLKFPSKSGLCTRFATELVLRTSSERRVEAHIIHPRSGFGVAHEEQRLDGFSKTNLGAAELEKIIEEAKVRMGIGPQGTSFSQSVLRIQIHGPDLPQLTLVDLPGFFHVATSKKAAEGREVVEALTARYMAQRSSIILAVIAANNDLENQVVLDKAKKYDPRKERTLGIITKPDTLEKNSQRERNYINVAKNREDSDYRFKLGWHVLRNRNERESEANTSYEDRDRNEKEFFESTIWRSLSSSSKGISELRTRLSSVLFDHVKRSLPDVIRGIEEAVGKRRERLLGLGDARTSPSQHRAYLGTISSRFERLARDAVRGIYSDDTFFGYEGLEEGTREHDCNPRKLRARIRALNRAFAFVLSDRGTTRYIKMPDGSVLPDSFHQNFKTPPAARDDAISQYSMFADSVEVTWEELNQEIKLEAMAEQGTELPGSINPSLAFKQFKQLVLPWQGIAGRHIELVMISVREFIDELLAHVVLDETTRHAILIECVEPFLEHKGKLLTEKLEELIGHFKGDYACQVDETFLRHLSGHVRKRLSSTKGSKALDVSEFSTEGVIDSMLTYYEMSLSTFTDNILILAVENCLIRKVPEMFQSTMVTSMDDDMLARLASETRSVREEREMLQQDLEILDSGLRECKRYRPREPRASHPSRSSAERLTSPPVTDQRRTSTNSVSDFDAAKTRPANGSGWSRLLADDPAFNNLSLFNAANNSLTPPRSDHGRKSSATSVSSTPPPKFAFNPAHSKIPKSAEEEEEL